MEFTCPVCSKIIIGFCDTDLMQNIRGHVVEHSSASERELIISRYEELVSFGRSSTKDSIAESEKLLFVIDRFVRGGVQEYFFVNARYTGHQDLPELAKNQYHSTGKDDTDHFISRVVEALGGIKYTTEHRH